MSCKTCTTTVVLPKGDAGVAAEGWKCIKYNESEGGDSVIAQGETTLTQMSTTALASKMHQVHSTMSLNILGDGSLNTIMRVYVGSTEVKRVNNRFGSDVESTTRELPMFWRGSVNKDEVISLTFEATTVNGISDVEIQDHSILVNQESEDAS